MHQVKQCTYRIQSTAKISETSSGGSPTVSRTITNVTRPACGIPAAPIDAAVDVILKIDRTGYGKYLRIFGL